MTICVRWNKMASPWRSPHSLFPSLAVVSVFAVAVPPLPLPGPYAVECSNVAQDSSRLAPGESVELYWEGVVATQRRRAAPDRAAGRSGEHADGHGRRAERPAALRLVRRAPYTSVVVICHPTSASNPRPDYQLPTDRPVPHMLRDGERRCGRMRRRAFPSCFFRTDTRSSHQERLPSCADGVCELRLRRRRAVPHRRRVLGPARARRLLDFVYPGDAPRAVHAVQALRPLAAFEDARLPARAVRSGETASTRRGSAASARAWAANR